MPETGVEKGNTLPPTFFYVNGEEQAIALISSTPNSLKIMMFLQRSDYVLQ